MTNRIAIISMVAAGMSLLAQSPAPTTPQSAPAVPAQDAGPSQEEVTRIKQVPYRPNLVRDPFSTPTDVEQGNKGELVDDIGVKGWLKAGGVAYAVVSDSRGNIKRLPVGHRFRDGEIVAIDDKSVTFHQWDISSTNRSVYRTVVKTFKREEGKR